MGTAAMMSLTSSSAAAVSHLLLVQRRDKRRFNHNPLLSPPPTAAAATTTTHDLLTLTPRRTPFSLSPPTQILPLFPSHHRFLITHRLSAITATAALFQDAGAAAIVMGGAYSLVTTFDNLTQRHLIDQSLSRKAVHILSGLLFMVSWPIFSTSSEARYFAALVPLVNCVRLVVHGLSLAIDEGLIKSVTREGKAEELLRGPLYYVIVLILCTLAFWRESPTGVIALAMMCGGDGIADIIGRRLGSMKIPYNQNKSWAGSISMFVFGFLVSMGMLYYFSSLGFFYLDWSQTIERVAIVSLVATAVESLPVSDLVDDNISVPLASIILSFFIFGY